MYTQGDTKGSQSNNLLPPQAKTTLHLELAHEQVFYSLLVTEMVKLLPFRVNLLKYGNNIGVNKTQIIKKQLRISFIIWEIILFVGLGLV